MTEFTMDRMRENLEALKMKNTLEILDNYLERAVAENLNMAGVWGDQYVHRAGWADDYRAVSFEAGPL